MKWKINESRKISIDSINATDIIISILDNLKQNKTINGYEWRNI